MLPVPYRCGAASAAALALALAAVAAGEELRLATGEVLEVEVIDRDADTIHVRHALLGEMHLPAERVALAGEPDPALGMLAEPMPQDDADAEAAVAAPEESEWKSKFVLAGSYSSGNTENAALTVSFQTVREREDTVLSLDMFYFYGQNDNVTSENRFYAQLRNDWLVPDHEKLFFFAQGRYDYDQFNSWRNRLGGYGGAGWHFIKRDDYGLTGRLGAGLIREWGSDDDDIKPEGLVGVEGYWQISERQKFTYSATWFPDLERFGEGRTVTGAEWSLLVDTETNLSLTAGLYHEYQGRVDPGRDHNDLKVYAGVQLDF